MGCRLDASSANIRLLSRGDPHFAFSITPPVLAPLKANLPLTQSAASNKATDFAATATPLSLELNIHQIADFGLAPPVMLGSNREFFPRRVAQAPSTTELQHAAKWSITIPQLAMDGLNEVYLQVRYQGDVARLYSDQRLLTDDFYNGLPWSIGLERFLGPGIKSNFELDVLPLRADAPVYLEVSGGLNYGPNGQTGRLDGMSLIPEYKLVINSGNR